MTEPLSVLIVEDSENDTLLLVSELDLAGYEPTYKRVDTAQAMVEALDEGVWDLVISDHRMPNFSSTAALDLVKDRALDIPFIIVSGTIGEETAVAAMKAGAHDYIMKGNRARLVPAIRRELREAEMRRERRRAERLLRESEERFRNVFKQGPLGIAVVGLDYRWVTVNATLCEMVGYTEDELTKLTFVDITHPDDIEADVGYAEKLSRGEIPSYKMEKRYIRKNREVLWIQLTASSIRDEQGKSLYYLSMIEDISSRRKAEEALRESEEKYRTLFEESLDGLFITSPGGRILDMNKKGVAMFDYDTKEEMLSLDLERDVYAHPPDRRRILAMVNAQGSAEYEVVVKKKNCEEMITHCALTAVKDERGVITSYRGIIRDITERRKVEEARLRFLERQERLNRLQQALLAPGELVQKLKMITDGVVDIFGTDFCRIWRIRSGDLCQHGCVHATVTEEPHVCKYKDKCLHLLASSGRYTHTDGLTHRRVPFGAYKIGRIASGQEHKFLTNDVVHDPRVHDHDWARELGLVSFAGYQLRPPSGETLGVLALFSKHTISQEEDAQLNALSSTTAQVLYAAEAEQRLKESDKQYRTIFEQSIDGVYSVARDGTITDANLSFCELFGYSREEMLSKDIVELYLDPADHPRFQKELEKNGFVKDYAVKLRKADGTELDCLVTSSLPFEREGAITGYRGILRDLTERKKLQRQLLQAQKMESIGTLAGGIAHDFNNLLQVVLGYSELVLGDEDLPGRFSDDLGKVLLAGKKGADLVQRLLTFSRKTDIKPLDIDLNQRIGQTHKFLQRTIPKMIDIDLVLAEDLARIHADPTQVDQVLMNLAVNARDAMPEGGKLVIETSNVVIDEDHAGSHLEAEPGPYVLLRVSDTGSGMDKETLEHIFEPFYTTKGPGQGTGLGLAMVFGIVRQHHGFINCYSEVGRGTTFKVYLPPVTSGTLLSDEPVVTSIPRGGTETVLLVDDEEFIRDLGARILERSGYKVLTACNGKEALDVYRSNKANISLVILDLVMPEMGGKQCLGELLKIDPKARVLIASGFAANGQTKEAIETGARDFVGKPYNMKGMLQTVREVLDEE
ncbi:MAG: PAS domain S-box protein [Pseudomonadota bacterium]